MSKRTTTPARPFPPHDDARPTPRHTTHALELVQDAGAEGRQAEDGGAREAGVRDEERPLLRQRRGLGALDPGLAERLVGVRVCVCV